MCSCPLPNSNGRSPPSASGTRLPPQSGRVSGSAVPCPSAHRNHAKSKSDHLLTGLLYDDAGHRMIPTHATKAGIRYRYYASLPHLKGESKTVSVGSVSRIPATDIED